MPQHPSFGGDAILRAARDAASQIITVAEIREGDEFGDADGWTAIEDAELLGSGEVSVRVQYRPDGGISDRIWANPDLKLKIVRPKGGK